MESLEMPWDVVLAPLMFLEVCNYVMTQANLKDIKFDEMLPTKQFLFLAFETFFGGGEEWFLAGLTMNSFV